MNNQNLEKGKATQFKKNDPRTVEMAKKGGESSGKAKGMRKILRKMLDMSLSPGGVVDFDKHNSLQGLLDADGNPKNMTVEQLLCLQLVNSALQGDLRALQQLIDLVGDGDETDELRRARELLEGTPNAID